MLGRRVLPNRPAHIVSAPTLQAGMVADGMDPLALQALMGHRSLRTTLRHYVALDEEHLRTVLVIGQEQDVPGGGFDPAQAFAGQMDKVRLWNTVLSPSDILGNFSHRLSGAESGLEPLGLLGSGL